ncbi:MAG TPA: hypothetical protein VGG72_21345 [Bryobacteraceae bacterium]
MNNLETELISSEIGHFVRPKQSKWKTIAEDLVAVAAIVGFVLLLLWLASIGAF